MKIYSRGSELDLTTPKVMGILNVTPDSFSDGGNHNHYHDAIEYAAKIVDEGASIIDVGGESTRPGFVHVTINNELDRVIPVVEAIAKRFDVWISVDTSKSEVMFEAAKVGMHLINDIRSLHGEGTLEIAVQTGLPICIMHTKEQSQSIQNNFDDRNIINDIKQYLNTEIQRCVDAGINKKQIILDPGFGFGKNLSHNYQILANLKHFHDFELPILTGMSRKSMIGKLLNATPKNRMAGSLACATIAAMQGAQIIRVHDVNETVQAMKIVQMTLLKKEKLVYE
ncbi:dihydropteroate synthase [Candidatus Hartigia pinicola]